MVRIERACIDLMMLLKRGECTELDLINFKEKIFRIALESVGGKEVWKEVNKILDK